MSELAVLGAPGKGFPVPSVLIVDDEPDVRFVIRRLLEQASWVVVAEACSGEEAITHWRELRPDMVLLDQRMPGLTGLETATQILAEDPSQPIVLFTLVKDAALYRAADELGVSHCLSKSDFDLLVPLLMAEIARERGGPTA